MKFCGLSNQYVQDCIKNLRKLGLIEKDGYKPNYKTIEFVFNSVNNAKSLEERKKWCENYKNKTVPQDSTEQVYYNGVHQTVPQHSTPNCTTMEYTDKEDVYKEDEDKKDVSVYNEDENKSFDVNCEISKEEIEKACTEELKDEKEKMRDWCKSFRTSIH